MLIRFFGFANENAYFKGKCKSKYNRGCKIVESNLYKKITFYSVKSMEDG